MSEEADKVIDLMYGRWRSQILYAGAELGVFDHLARNCSKQADAVAVEISADEKLLYRLMRALASLGLLVEDESRGFAISETGELLRSDHPQSLRYRVLVAEGPEHYAIWKYLPDIIRDGKQDGFIREYGARAFEYARTNSHYRRIFDQGMTGHSATQNNSVLEALRDYEFSTIRTICDVGGGHGRLVCALLQAHPHLSGLVLDLPEVFEEPGQLWASRLGLEERCRYVAGNMFNNVPRADAYSLKMILHDWDDQECIKILSNIRTAATPGARVLVMEQVVPGPHEPHIAKLFDIHMMCWGTGRERTEPEYARLLEAAGWKYFRTWYPKDRALGVVEGRFSS
jgi:hypothetical protein